MSVSDGLLQHARDQLVPEPIRFVVGDDGLPRFATRELPWVTVIDARGGVIFPGVTMDANTGLVTIVAGSRVARYRRRAWDIHGAWICELEP